MIEKSTVKAVDFDGTMAFYEGIEGDYAPDKVGGPIELMVARVKAWLAAGKKVVIFTARVNPFHGKDDVELARKTIQDWCKKYIGCELEVTHEKHPSFEEVWDDKAVRVVKDNGAISDGTDVDDPLVKKEADAIGSFFG